MERIKVTENELEQISVEIKATSAALESDMDRISDLMSKLPLTWEGEGANTFFYKVEYQLDECKELIQTLESMAQQIDTMRELYREATENLLFANRISVKDNDNNL